MLTFVHRWAVAASLCGACALAGAAPVVLAGLSPFNGGINGVESDSGTPPPYAQSFTAPAGAMLDMIVWWGYRLNDQSGGAPDNFIVSINGVAKTGALSVVGMGAFDKYTLDIADELLSGNSLEITNDGAFEWYWQGIDNRDFNTSATFPVAFNLLGTLAAGTVAEPGTAALVGVAGLAMLTARRRRG